METQEVLFDIYVNEEDDLSTITNQLEGYSNDDLGIYQCYANIEDGYVRIEASVPEFWDKNDADSAMESLLKEEGFDYDYFDVYLQ